MIRQGKLLVILAMVLMVGRPAMAMDGYELLFQGTSSRLTPAEKQQIFETLGFRVSMDGESLIDEVCGDAVNPHVVIDDLNGDGSEEVFVTWGNACTSGQAGATISLFIKGKSVKYIDNFGFPAISYEKLSTGNKGFPDLKIGGAGFCHPVWRWDGKKYQQYRNEPEVQGGCDGVE